VRASGKRAQRVSQTAPGRALFGLAAAWNAAAAMGAVALANPGPRARLGLPPAADPLAWHLTALCIALFGLGYLWVARDPRRGREIVALGALGKPLVFAIALGHVLAGSAPAAAAAAAFPDLAFGLLFWRFLRRHRP
jgi:hypothetical protein